MDVTEWPAIKEPKKYVGKVIIGMVTDGYLPQEEVSGCIDLRGPYSLTLKGSQKVIDICQI